MKSQIILGFFLALLSVHLYSNIQHDNFENLFEQWKKQHGKEFNAMEDVFRKMIFIKNYEDIVKHNSNSLATYQMGVNEFTHLTTQEFKALFLNFHDRKSSINQIQVNVDKSNQIDLDNLKDVDWSTLGKVSPVKAQGNCDAGYAFCTVSLAQSYFLFKSTNLTLSEQMLIDCAGNYSTFGCSGGTRTGSLKFVKDIGLDLQSKYPYKGVKGTCAKAIGDNKINWNTFEANGCDGISNGLQKSPLTVAVNALQWQNYRAGVFDGCTSTEVTHDILLVGNTLTYWRLKNSWGQKWGEYGYIRLKIGNTCGICEKPAYGFTL